MWKKQSRNPMPMRCTCTVCFFSKCRPFVFPWVYWTSDCHFVFEHVIFFIWNLYDYNFEMFQHFQSILYFWFRWCFSSCWILSSSVVMMAVSPNRSVGCERSWPRTAWNSTRNNLWSGDRQQELKTNENNCFSKMPMVSVMSFLGVSCNVDHFFWKNSRPQLDRNLGDQDSMLEIPRPSHGHIPLLPLPCPRRVCWLPRLPQMRRKQHLITFSWVNDDVMSSDVTQMAVFWT